MYSVLSALYENTLTKQQSVRLLLNACTGQEGDTSGINSEKRYGEGVGRLVM